MKILAVYNIKGGVGKTASSVNLSYLSARDGLSTLVWDLDPQGAASFYFRVRPKVKGGGKKLLKGKRPIERAIKSTDYENLDLLPADFSYRHLDLALDGVDSPHERLRSLLEPLEDEYEAVFLDCAPSISLVSEAVFAAADALVVPMIPTTLSLRTLAQLLEFREANGLGHLGIFPFFSMVDRRKALHRDVCRDLPQQYPDVLSSVVPYATEVEKMGLERAPVCAFAPRSEAAEAYAHLWDELRWRVGGL